MLRCVRASLSTNLGLVDERLEGLFRAQVVLVQREALEDPAQGHSAPYALLELDIARGDLACYGLLKEEERTNTGNIIFQVQRHYKAGRCRKTKGLRLNGYDNEAELPKSCTPER
jgi:hypothetical protein